MQVCCRRIADNSINCNSRNNGLKRGKQLMPHATTRDDVRIYFEEAGQRSPIIFLHEFAADYTN